MIFSIFTAILSFRQFRMVRKIYHDKSEEMPLSISDALINNAVTVRSSTRKRDRGGKLLLHTVALYVLTH